VASKLVLASNSPRRRTLLIEAGFEFESIGPRVAERLDANLTLRELTSFNAIRKGIAVARRYPDRVVLSADTLVALDNLVLGKPENIAQATSMLERLSGQIHEVCSTVFICHLADSRTNTFSEISQVQFRRLTSQAISDYFAKVNPLDKAGAYAAQGEGRDIIAKIDGSYTNVVGLPMEKTVLALAEFGIEPKSTGD
jgi:nucleoside triphosphate pyrophosphatase